MIRHYIYQLLTESLDSVIASNPHIPEEIIRSYHQNALPKNNKADKLLNFVLKLHKQGHITTNDNSELQKHLSILHNTNKLSKLKDIHSFTSLKELTQGVNDNKALTKKETIDKDSPVVFENEHIIIRQHLNHPSAVKAAMMNKSNPMFDKVKEEGKCSWCVSLDNQTGLEHYNYYTENNEHPMYTIFNKRDNRIHALVANPIYSASDVQLRDELDKDPHNSHIGLHSFMLHHNGIEHSKVGDYLFKISPHTKELFDKLPRNATSEHIDKALNDIDENVRIAAIKHPNATSEHIDKALNDENYKVRETAIQHPNATSEHLDKALNDSSWSVRARAIKHPNSTKEHINKALNDSIGRVSRIAKNELERRYNTV